MERFEMERVNKICIEELIKEFGADFVLDYRCSTEKSFTDYFESNVEFSQVFFSINFPGYLKEKNVRLNISNEEAIELVAKFNKLNERLKEIQKDIAKSNLSEFDLCTYNYFNTVGSDIGICHLNHYKRCKSREEEEEQRENEELFEKMKTDAKFRKEVEWFASEDRPYGGAFSSIDEFYNYIR